MALFSAILYFVPEAEPVDLKSKQTPSQDPNRQSPEQSARLMNVGIAAALGISLHNFPEGLGVFLACLHSTQRGLPLALAIAAHNIPEGPQFSLSLFFFMFQLEVSMAD